MNEAKQSPRIEDNIIYWYSGDTVDIVFDIDFRAVEIETEEEYLIPLDPPIHVVFILYDFLHNKVLEKDYDNVVDNTIEYNITKEESEEIRRGDYFLTIEIYKEDMKKTLLHSYENKVRVE